MKNLIVDLDGTLADCTHRLVHIQKNNKDFDAFYAGIKDDTVIKHIDTLLKLYLSAGYKLYFITGRGGSKQVLDDTNEWLKSHGYVNYELHTRRERDYRPDFQVKKELVIKTGLSPQNVDFVLEDRSSVVKMWRSLGFNCLQVADGDF